MWFTNLNNNSIGQITPAGVVSNFSGTGVSLPYGIAAGPDGNLWFTNLGNWRIGRITPAGIVSTFDGGSYPYAITAGPDGNLWFTNPNIGTSNSIGRITPAGSISTFTGGINATTGIASGPDGNLWFANSLSDSIGRITSDGTVANFTGMGIRRPSDITAGPDGNMWFTNDGNDSIGRITPAGVVSNFTGTGIRRPRGIAAGPDGSVWFSNHGNSSIGKVTPAGVVSNFTGTGVSAPLGIAAGPDGNMWFTNDGNNSIGRITTAGVVSNFTGTGIGRPTGIAAGPDGNLWFTNYGNWSIGKITPAGVVSNFAGNGISAPVGIAAGPDGTLWFVNQQTSSIGRITPAGGVTDYGSTGLNDLYWITAGPDGNMWFTSLSSAVARIATGVQSQAPAITSAHTTSFTVGTAGSFTVTATGVPAPTLTQTGQLPTGVSFNASTGELSGTPTPGTAGTYPITFTASNGVSPAASQAFTLSVGAGSPGQLVAGFTATPTSGVAPLSVAFTDTSTGGPTSFLWNFGDGSPTSSTRSPSHLYNGSGTFTVTLTVSAGSTTDVKTGSIQVRPARYVALGDSFSSGEGIPEAGYTVDGVNTDDANNRCHRSVLAYPERVWPDVSMQRTFVACSGAVLLDYHGANHLYPVEPRQREAVLDSSPDFVTVTMGGNDVGFPQIMAFCVVPGPDCQSSISANVTDSIDALYPDLRSLYTQIKIDSGGKPVWVLGYPKFLGATSSTCQLGLSTIEIGWINERVAQLDDVIEQAAIAAGVHFVDTLNAFGADVICAKNGEESTELANGLSKDLSKSFHPNWKGHARLAQVLGQAVGWPYMANPAPGNPVVPPDPGPHISLRPLGALNSVQSKVTIGASLLAGVAQLKREITFLGVPGERYSLRLFSEPRDMGEVQAGPDGRVVIALQLPEDLEPEAHTLLITGADPAGGTMQVLDPFWLDRRTAMSISASPNSSVQGDPVTISAAVTVVGGGTVPTGTVRFDAGGTTVGSSPLVNGLVSVTTTQLAPGTNEIVATYLPDEGWYPTEQRLNTTVTPSGREFTPLTPARIFDSRTSVGGHQGKLGAGETATVVVTGVGGVPASGVDSVVLNVTATDGNASTFLTVFPAGQSRPFASNLNVVAGQDIPNLVVAKVGANGSVALYNNQGSVDVIFDVVGWYRPAPTCFTSLTPARILDSRNSTKVGPGQTRDVRVTGLGGVPSSGVGAVVLNVTATQASANTYLTVFPAGQSRPDASNLNVVPSQDVPNLVVAKVGTNGDVSVYNNHGSIDVIFDVVGWHPTGASCFTSLTPSRIFDSRTTTKLDPAQARDVKVTGAGGVPATGVEAVVLNVTATEATAATYLTVYPAGQSRPDASNLNVVPGQDVPNLVVAKVSVNGSVTIYNNQGSTHAIYDVVGYYPS